MKTVKVSGKTIEEAISNALKELETKEPEQIEYTVLEEPKSGFLGFIGAKPAILEASLKRDPIEEAEQFLLNVIDDMGVRVQVEKLKEGRETTFSLTGEDLGVMIGKRGKTLDSLQYLVNLVANRFADRHARIVLDAENYRQRRQEALEQLAERLAFKAARSGENVVLEPMTARERKIIHAALQRNDDVDTYSDGTEPRRYVVIAPKS
ncbi:RNA-binding cell elongation regulator Jag/EloR [Salibacterium aidingense]|uniref:RNA-binding cell elongation regulator Jag/EloR n=1 Tax=Salibacterium aidingense TaxID=384933 RepID=UPI000420DADA|nr:RNA-binding cell elongation regulator Jag/EloR [Salibacterium aidingense]